MKTAFQDLERNDKTKKNMIFFMPCKCTRIYSPETPEREFKVQIFGVNFYATLPWYKCTDS